jgi:hypothetical protein
MSRLRVRGNGFWLIILAVLAWIGYPLLAVTPTTGPAPHVTGAVPAGAVARPA